MIPGSSPDDKIERACISFVKEYQEINGSFVQVFEKPPTPLEFLRECVHPNRPALIKDAFSHWPAKRLWTNEYLREKIGADTPVTVATTPNGYADAVTFDPKTQKEYFAMPYEQSMPFGRFLDILEGKEEDPRIHYISLQNDSLNTEYNVLASDVDADIAWCSEALGKKPDATNFWFGSEESVTSLHKDPYENCYAVIRGQKTFVLFPPAEYFCLHETLYPSAAYEPNDRGELELKPLEGDQKVPWIPVDPLYPNMERYPRFQHARPIEVTVNEGDMLYLPAFWFHHVLQKGEQGVIAVNSWFDCEYRNILYPSMTLFRELANNEE
ncbi:putative pla2g4b [Syncephalastrum racemosum]|uniref:Putative pla2g4b n=1 Tax=Syncephalastrum racemosum TaxID=13706 RepID=A0A1X2HCP2_SYNRA|nr:putative pla2g4b [Syncephalastrum racemosum]